MNLIHIEYEKYEFGKFAGRHSYVTRQKEKIAREEIQ